MKKVLCCCMLVFVLVLCGCNQAEHGTGAGTKMIDFTDYTVNEVIEWANENDVASKFTYVYSAETDKPAGCVIAQSVESGEPITDGTVITVASSKLLIAGEGTRMVVPNIIGKSLEDAKSELSALGLQIDIRYSSSSKEKDTVILTDPLPGVGVSVNSKVVLTLSTGVREAQVSIDLMIDSRSDDDNTIKVYVDGELDRSKTVCLDSSVTHKIFTFSGSGRKEIKFTINNEADVVYNVDFSSGQVYLIS